MQSMEPWELFGCGYNIPHNRSEGLLPFLKSFSIRPNGFPIKNVHLLGPIYMHLCMCVCLFVCMYVFMYVCMYICLYVFMYVCMYVCRPYVAFTDKERVLRSPFYACNRIWDKLDSRIQLPKPFLNLGMILRR